MRIHAMRGKIPLGSNKRQSKRMAGKRSSSKVVIFTQGQIKQMIDSLTLKGN